MSSLYVGSNNGATTLATASINSTATSFTVASGQGDRFPSPTGGDYFLATFENGSTREIMCVVGRSTDTMTVGIPGSASANVAGRNYESILGMTAATWTSGAVISCRATASLVALGANSQATIPTTIHAATAKTPVVDADEVVLVDSEASWVIKKFTLTTLWTWIQTHLASPGAIGATTAATLRGTTVESTIATGTAPFIVASTTEVANLKAATATDTATKTGTGSTYVTNTSPTLVTPALGTPASGALDNCTSNTEAVGNNSTQLATTAFCEAGFVNNDVGSGNVGVISMNLNNSGGTINNDATVVGSALSPCWQDINGNATYSSYHSGTWRNVSGIHLPVSSFGLYQRIS